MICDYEPKGGPDTENMYVWTFGIQMRQRGQDFSVAWSWLKQTWSSTAQQATAFNTQYGRVEIGHASGKISAFISHGLRPYYTPPAKGVLPGTREGQIHLQTQSYL